MLDSEDFIAPNLLLPLGPLTFFLFYMTRWSWGFDHYLVEASNDKGIKLPCVLKYYFQFELPILVLVILFQGLFI